MRCAALSVLERQIQMRTFLLIVVLLLSVIVATGGSQSTPQPTVWEYKFEYEINEKKANALGAQGWELISVSPTSSTSSVTEYAFKRAK